jgi:hypothetical protein
MRDLNLNRIINVVAAGSILLTATACGGPEKRLARKFCKGLYKCDRSDFDDEFSSMKDCIDETQEYIEDMLDDADDYGGSKCADAMQAFLTCYANTYKRTCDYDDVEDDCEDEYDDVYDDCY